MNNTGHPAVIKAKRLGRIAFEHDWKGNIESESGTTIFRAWRNDETVMMQWNSTSLVYGEYRVFNYKQNLSSTSLARKVIEGWPNISRILKYIPDGEFKGDFVKRYSNVPFNWETAPNDEIIAAMIGRQIRWYSTLSNKIQTDIVHRPKTTAQKGKLEVKQVGNGRKMFNFIGNQGFRSVLLDTLIQVG